VVTNLLMAVYSSSRIRDLLCVATPLGCGLDLAVFIPFRVRRWVRHILTSGVTFITTIRIASDGLFAFGEMSEMTFFTIAKD